MNYSVVIVTYNRCSLLKECVGCILAQKKTPAHIIIINNASTDDTADYLETLTDDCFVIVNEKKNYGGAGGFYSGIKKAQEIGDDAVIIIDDDAMLDKNFAKILCNAAQKNPKIAAFAGSVWTDGNIICDHRQTLKKGFRMCKIPKEDYEKKAFLCDTASFCGLMIRKSVIDKIGLPEKKYFIWYDDTEYCIRIGKISKILVIPAAKLDHKTVLAAQEWPRRYTWKDYYGIRNKIHMVKKHGNILDYIIMRADIMINVGIRNRIFDIVKMNGLSWKNEIDIYKKAVKDSHSFVKNVK